MPIAKAYPMDFAGRNDDIKFDRRQVADHSRKGETETRNGILKTHYSIFPCIYDNQNYYSTSKELF